MSDVVFILGAGASVHTGAPVMANFLDRAYDLALDKEHNAISEEVARVYSAINAMKVIHSTTQLDLNNVESVFTALEMAKTLGRLPGNFDVEIDEVIASLKILISETLERTVRFRRERRHLKATDEYKQFAEMVNFLKTASYPRRTSSIITFNYDIALDLALSEIGLEPAYMLDDTAAPGDLPVLKLHGSLNWASIGSNDEIHPVSVEEFRLLDPLNSNDGGYGVAPISTRMNQALLAEGTPSEEWSPFIVPPTWNKAEYSELIAPVWRAAAKELGEAEHIFIIGYSFPDTDHFFHHLLGIGASGDKNLRSMEVINPDPTVSERFKKILGPGALGRYQFHEETFGAAVRLTRQKFPARS